MCRGEGAPARSRNRKSPDPDWRSSVALGRRGMAGGGGGASPECGGRVEACPLDPLLDLPGIGGLGGVGPTWDRWAPREDGTHCSVARPRAARRHDRGRPGRHALPPARSARPRPSVLLALEEVATPDPVATHALELDGASRSCVARSALGAPSAPEALQRCYDVGGAHRLTQGRVGPQVSDPTRVASRDCPRRPARGVGLPPCTGPGP